LNDGNGNMASKHVKKRKR